MERVDIFKKFYKDFEIVDIDKEDISFLPKEWYEIFQEKKMQIRVNKVIDLWNKYLKNEIPNIILFIQQNVKNIELVRYKNQFTMIYEIIDSNKESTYFEGRCPVTSIVEIKSFKLPNKIADFYCNIHDGFYRTPLIGEGILPLEKVDCLADDEWGILDDLDEPLQISMENSYSFFQSGGGGYVVMDFNNTNENNATIWYASDQPEYGLDFWQAIDEWMPVLF